LPAATCCLVTIRATCSGDRATCAYIYNRSKRGGRALRALRTLSALSALSALGTLRALRARCALRALRARRALRTVGTLRATGPTSARGSCRAVGPVYARGAVHAPGTGRTLGSLGSLGSLGPLDVPDDGLPAGRTVRRAVARVIDVQVADPGSITGVDLARGGRDRGARRARPRPGYSGDRECGHADRAELLLTIAS
jgi:hypothetical protein